MRISAVALSAMFQLDAFPSKIGTSVWKALLAVQRMIYGNVVSTLPMGVVRTFENILPLVLILHA